MAIIRIFVIIFSTLYRFDTWNQFPQSPEINEIDEIINVLTAYVNEIALNNSGIPKIYENHPIDVNSIIKITPTFI